MTSTTGALLEAEALAASYGKVEALKPCALQVMPGEAVVVLGPNGAGKSTLMRALMGLVTARGGVKLEGRRIDGWSTQDRAKAGMVLVPEGRGILGPLSVIENLELGAYARYGRASRSEIAASFDSVFDLFPRLKERRRQKAGSLSGGELQMLAIGRALMAEPRLLLLDEPSLGLAPRLVDEIFAKLAELQRRGIALLLVEQKAPPALQIAERAYILRTGQMVAAMATRDIDGPEVLARLYLGA